MQILKKKGWIVPHNKIIALVLNQVIKQYLLLFIVITTTSCFGQRTIIRDSLLSGYTPESIRYDTIQGDFLYENFINAYVAGGDAVVKHGDFIEAGTVNKNLYKQGLFTYFTSDFRYRDMSAKNHNVHYDSASIFQALNEMRSEEH